MTCDNPILTPSDRPYSSPDWPAIRPEHIVPAVQAAFTQEEEAWEQIATCPQPATFQNTALALEDAARLSDYVLSISWTLMSSIGGEEYERIEADVSALLNTHNTKFWLDKRIYDRLSDIDLDELDGESARLVTELLETYTRSGVQLSEADKETLRDIDAQLAALHVEFSQRAIKAMDDHAVVFTESECAGLAEDQLNAARNAEGNYRFVLDNFTNQMLLTQLKDPQSRERLFTASITRGLGAHASSDTRQIVLDIVQLRAQRARLLGYPFFAQITADESVAKDADAIEKLLSDVARRSVAAFNRELPRMQELADADRQQIRPADVMFYQEKMRAELGLDDAALRPYLALDNVVEKGIFFAAHQLYGLSFTERTDIPGYVDSMRTWEVSDADGKPIGLFQADYFRRPGKAGGAWMSGIHGFSSHDGTLPLIFNNANFTQPEDPSQPCLLTWDNVITVFHEFGHALHGLLSKATYRSLSGARVPRDFVELPSQLNEMWAYHPQVMASYAVHYQTGEPLPKDLVDTLNASITFGQAFATTEFVSAALLDHAWHRITPDQAITDIAAFEKHALAHYGIDTDLVPPRYRSAYFSHTFAGGYAAAYYAYLWADVLVSEIEEWFKTEGARDGDGGLNREAGAIVRREILERGNTRDPMESFRAVRGRDPHAAALMRKRGLEA
ncbi:M3 family metallopeptidase [Trueperella sp. LYQ143]|uniref:M3 family metallopeptidase n=1 Tax=Trueperella sp. LYQ143 TaxID=3391059 RepID=UPI003983969E